MVDVKQEGCLPDRIEAHFVNLSEMTVRCDASRSYTMNKDRSTGQQNKHTRTCALPLFTRELQTPKHTHTDTHSSLPNTKTLPYDLIPALATFIVCPV